MSLSITQSEAFAHNGFLNAAGLFFSIKKWPLQANGYTINGKRMIIGKNITDFQKIK